MGSCLAPVSGTRECAWCGVYTAAEVGVYKNVTEVQIFFEGNQGTVTKGRAYCGTVFQNMPVRPENPANWEVVGIVEHEYDGSFASCWHSQTKGTGSGDTFDAPQCFLSG